MGYVWLYLRLGEFCVIVADCQGEFSVIVAECWVSSLLISDCDTSSEIVSQVGWVMCDYISGWVSSLWSWVSSLWLYLRVLLIISQLGEFSVCSWVLGEFSEIGLQIGWVLWDCISGWVSFVWLYLRLGEFCVIVSEVGWVWLYLSWVMCDCTQVGWVLC